MNFIYIFLAVGCFCFKTCTTSDISSADAIQIIVPVNHVFQLQTDQLKPILEHENIKDRKVVVVSIAGAFRQGKSFMMNLFLKYLYAQYKAHDVTDWIGETSNTAELNGFKWRSGRKRETIGIWMWSEIFTHDFENGEKIAIILLDTQGIFDDQSSVRDCTTIFALSMMLSSVQCYNLMQHIKEDNLQHLELFSEYGRLAMEQSAEKPFRKLLFVVRDWPYAFETDYGWNGQKVIDENLAGNDGQTPEMLQLRTRLQSSFENITAFLMPHPGMIVAQGNEFTGNINDIAPEFIKYAKEFVPAIFAPENLIPKKINGQMIRAQDLLQYLQAYVNAFNGDALPEPKSVLMATAEVSNLILFNECVNTYDGVMRNTIANIDPYVKENDLIEMHQRFKAEAVAKFTERPKLGGAEMTASFQQRIEQSIEEKFNGFRNENDQKRNAFIERANFHNDQLAKELFERVKTRVLEEADHQSPDAVHAHLHNIFNAERQAAINEFDSRKMGDDEISNPFRGKLEQDLNNHQAIMSQTLDSFNHWSHHYNHRMQESLNGVEYFRLGDFANLHQTIRHEAVSQFQAHPGEDNLKFKLQIKIEQSIDGTYPHFENQNVAKRHNFREASRCTEYGVVHAWRWPNARASCPPGKKLTGGGGACTSLNGIGWVFLHRSNPEGNDWVVGCDTPKNQNVQAEAWAICIATVE